MKRYDCVPGLEYGDSDLGMSPAWFLDGTHSVPPWTPMFGWFWVNFCRHGMQYGAEKLSLPTVKGWDWRFKDGGGYLTLLLVGSDAEKKEREAVFKEAIRPFIENYDKVWYGFVDEMLERYKSIKSVDLASLSNIQALEKFEEVIDTTRRMWEIHMYMMYGTYTPYVLFESMAKELVGIDDTHPTFHKLMSGFDNESFRVDRGLWELSILLKDMGLDDIVANTPSQSVIAELGKTEKGKEFLAKFDQFLEEKGGWRMERMAEINVPTWDEDPSPAFNAIKMYLKTGDFDLEKEREKAEKERKATEAEVLEKIPQDQRGWFSILLKVAQNSSMFSEEHNHYLDLYCHAMIRRVVMDIGRRFAKSGAIAEVDDIFYLVPDEVRKAGINPDMFDLKQIVADRKAEWEAWNKDGNPPAILKEGFTMEDAVGVLAQSMDPIALKVVVGNMPVPKPELKADLFGICGSPGMTEGIARVIQKEEELERIQKGDILVAATTSPSWTPVFSLISGAVVDRGGSLSHAAIVGREYGIPVVINTFEGTQKIKDGQRIKIDANLGAVYIVN